MSAGLELEGLEVRGPGGPIVTRMDLRIEPGETVALVGESGSGKSMTAKAITGLLPEGVSASGKLTLGVTVVDLAAGSGAFSQLRGRRISLLLQNPFTSLSPVHRCADQIVASSSARDVEADVARRLAEVDLPVRVARQYPFELSGGMRQRVALAASLASDPEVLIGDEPTTALDVTTQREVLDLLARIQRDRGMSLLLITHDLRLARERADRVLVMYAGRLVESGSGSTVFAAPRHPYTRGLRDSEPPIDRRLGRMPVIAGNVPRPWEVPAGCAFAPRCPLVDDRCRTDQPVISDPDDGAACWYPLDPEVATAAPALRTDEPSRSHDRLLTVTGLSRRFRPEDPPALDDVAIRVGAGETVGIVGESGSGKTTLARCLVGLERPDSGIIEWAGEDRSERRAQIVFQDPTSALNPAMTVAANLWEALRVAGRSKDEIPTLLELVGLPADYARRRPHALSGGEQQRVAIARAIAPEPRLLICDEPVSSLDVSVQAQILNLLNELVARLGLAVLFITHDLAVVRQVVDRVYVMHGGRVLESGLMNDVASSPAHEYTRLLFASVPGA
jgi:peptide/nickel transport system ATP-binding protein